MEWIQLREELQTIESGVRDLGYGESFARFFFKTREVIEKYFGDTNYIEDIRKINLSPQSEEQFWESQGLFLGILEGLKARIDLAHDDNDAREVPISANREIEELRKKSEFLADQILEERKRSEEDANQIRQLSDNLGKERKLMEERYKELSKVELLKQEDIFIKAAATNKLQSWFWLAGIIVSSIGLIFLLSCFVKDFCLDVSCLQEQKKICPECGNTLLIFELTRATIYRVAIISLAVYFVVFVIKNYNALMHNYTINIQKANSFAAAFVMINGPMTEKGKDDIMTQAAQAIFSHQNTGYLGKDNEPSNPLIVEKVIEKVMGKGKD
ncbi:MAG: hypothetical protein JWQ09_5195 [Segetibacter sp.]|nr:hypothetical protein [Segetibacter sp.]